MKNIFPQRVNEVTSDFHSCEKMGFKKINLIKNALLFAGSAFLFCKKFALISSFDNMTKKHARFLDLFVDVIYD